jgi:hypothetical protein
MPSSYGFLLFVAAGRRKRDGGGGGNRTRVLKPRGQSIYARIL